MGKNRKNLYKTFTKWSLSYVILSIVAIGVILYCSMRYSQALRQDLEYTNAVQMEITQLQMDRTVRNLRTFTNRANLNKTVRELRQAASYQAVAPYELYELVRNLANEMVFDTDTHECYLYFPASDFLISGRYYNNSRNFYDIALESAGFSYEDWHGILSQEYRTPQIFSLDTKSGKALTVLLKPLDITSRSVPPAYAVMMVDLNELLKASDWMNQDRDSMCIIDRTNRRLVSNVDLEEDLRQELLDAAMDNQERTFENGQVFGNFVVSFLPSRHENWDYVVITQEQGIVTQISELQRLVAGLIFLYLLVSGCAIGYVVITHYRPLRNVVDILAQQEEGADRQVNSDAYEYINRSVHKLLDKNKENSSVINRQRSAISRELFHRLLTERNACAVLDQGLLSQYGMCAGDSCCCVLAYRMEKADGPDGTADAGKDTRVDAQEVSWFILQNVTEENLESRGLKRVWFQESEREMVFLIWTDGGAEDLRRQMTDALASSRDFIHKHFKFRYRTGLSDIHAGSEELHQAYQEVGMVFEYQKKDEGRDIISYGEINLLPKDTLLKYPMNVENRLVHSVENGDAQEVCREIRALLEENQVNCLAPEAMQFLVSNIAASIIRAAGGISRETALSISQKALLEACRQEDRGRMQEELNRLAVTACQEITEYNKKEKENQKRTLCEEIVAYVEAHYQDPDLSVNSMAAQFGVQAAYLSKLFREMKGGKLSQYIHEVRLNHVKQMLLDGERLEDIALSCGFGSQRTFLRIFKQYEGVTPTQFKDLEEKKIREEEKP